MPYLCMLASDADRWASGHLFGWLAGPLAHQLRHHTLVDGWLQSVSRHNTQATAVSCQASQVFWKASWVSNQRSRVFSHVSKVISVSEVGIWSWKRKCVILAWHSCAGNNNSVNLREIKKDSDRCNDTETQIFKQNSWGKAH
jgi:hypothetical protein